MEGIIFDIKKCNSEKNLNHVLQLNQIIYKVKFAVQQIVYA